jgi:hypothetical protein
VPFSQIAPAAPLAKSNRDEAAGSSAGAAARADAPSQEAQLGTGHGRSEFSPVRYVGFERASSEPAETLVIYYDSYQNLLARGIIPRYVPMPRPVPNPFPGFVQDPPA